MQLGKYLKPKAFSKKANYKFSCLKKAQQHLTTHQHFGFKVQTGAFFKWIFSLIQWQDHSMLLS
jgi:hypothetical protein